MLCSYDEAFDSEKYSRFDNDSVFNNGSANNKSTNNGSWPIVKKDETCWFDVIIGNPPYGAELPNEIQNYLNNKFIKWGSETAISFIKLSTNLLKKWWFLSFIVPKSFSYSSNYGEIRKHILSETFEIIDCKKVWKEVY